MKIGIITGEFPPMQGGVGDFSRELSRALAVLGHDIHILTSCDQSAKAETSRSYAVHRIVHDWDWNCWGEICQWVEKQQPDIINIQYQAAAYDMRPAIHLLPWRLRRLGNAPVVVVTYHDLKLPYLFPKAGPLRQQAVLALARWSEAAIVTNKEDHLTLDRYQSLAPSTFHIPIGSNITVQPPPGYDRHAWRARYGLAPNDLLLAYFGFLNVSKGGETLIRTLHKLILNHPAEMNVHLLMIGGQVGSSDPTNEAYLHHIKTLIAKLELDNRVHWSGYTPAQEVSANLLAADLCLLPYQDGVSFRRGSFMAALIHGRPIISTQPQVPLPELRDGENILLASPGDIDALAAAVARLAADPDLRQRLGEGAATLAQQFTWEKIASRTAKLFAFLKKGGRV